MKEHTDYEVVQSTNPDFNKAIVRVNFFREHRQTIQYIQPQDAQKLGQVTRFPRIFLSSSHQTSPKPLKFHRIFPEFSLNFLGGVGSYWWGCRHSAAFGQISIGAVFSVHVFHYKRLRRDGKISVFKADQTAERTEREEYKWKVAERSGTDGAYTVSSWVELYHNSFFAVGSKGHKDAVLPHQKFMKDTYFFIHFEPFLCFSNKYLT